MTGLPRFKVTAGKHLRVMLFGVLVGLAAGAFGDAPSAHAKADIVPTASPPASPPAPPPAPARNAETERIFAEARMHFDAGQEQYAHQRYGDAIRSFQAGYALVPRPNFLVNIGQAYRKLGNLVRAKEAYVAYVRALPANSALRDQALQVLAEIEVQLQDGQDSKAGQARQRAAQGTGAEPSAAPLPLALSGLPEPTDRPLALPAAAAPRSRLATWLGVGMGGAGLGLLAAGGGFQLRAKSASDALARASERGEAFDASEERAGKRAEKVGSGLFVAGGAVMAAGLLLFLIVDGASGDESLQAAALVGRPGKQNTVLSAVALSPDGLGLAWSF